jgi:uncharacterized protein DUF4154
VLIGQILPGNRPRLARWPLGIYIVILCTAQMVAAGGLEYEVKAAMIYNFAKFVEWPSTGNSQPFVLGVVGDDPFGQTLERLVADRAVSGREIRIERYPTADDLGRCDILFIAESESPELPLILAQVHDRGVLTVGDKKDFARDGGVIGFRLEGNKVRFDINVDAARRSGLRISSKLLRLARVVHGEQSR